MPKWLIELRGDKQDLQYLVEVYDRLTMPEMKVIQQEGRFYLQSTELDNLVEARGVLECATTLVKRMNGYARSKWPNFQSVEIAGGVAEIVAESKPPTQYIFPKSIPSRERVYPPSLIIIEPDGTLVKPQKVDEVERKLMEDPNVQDALEHFANDFGELYKSFEIICGDLGGQRKKKGSSSHKRGRQAIIAMGWVTDGEIERFTRTANTVERHDPEMFETHPKPMTLSEAHTFIEKMFEKWLSYKRQLLRSADQP